VEIVLSDLYTTREILETYWECEVTKGVIREVESTGHNTTSKLYGNKHESMNSLSLNRHSLSSTERDNTEMQSLG